jgi:hypothetical protein
MTDQPTQTSTELEVLNPTTGEVLDLASAPTDELATVLDKLKSFTDAVTDFRRDVVDEMLRRMDKRGLWTVHLGGVKVTGTSPAGVEYEDLKGMWHELGALVRRGILEQGAVDDAVSTKTEWVTKAKGITALKKLPEARAIVEAHERPSSKRRSVRVESEQ